MHLIDGWDGDKRSVFTILWNILPTYIESWSWSSSIKGSADKKKMILSVLNVTFCSRYFHMEMLSWVSALAWSPSPWPKRCRCLYCATSLWFYDDGSLNFRAARVPEAIVCFFAYEKVKVSLSCSFLQPKTDIL